MSRTFSDSRTQSGASWICGQVCARRNRQRVARAGVTALATCALIVGAAVVDVGVDGTAFITAAHAQQKPAEVPTAMKAYDSGVKAFNAGKSQQAIDQLSSALRIGGLGTSDLARAMYLRGLAYKKQNKPGLAISDLTSAVWIKNGLNESDRQKALAERQEAYAAAGISSSDVAAAPTVSQGPPSAPAPQPTATPVATAPSSTNDSNLMLTDPSVSATAQPTATPGISANTAVARSSAPISGGMTDAISGRYDSAPRVAAAAPAPQAGAFTTETTTAPSATATSSSPPSSSGSSFGSGIAQAPAAIGNFFSNLFSGSGTSMADSPATPSLGYASDSAGASPSVPAANSIVAGPVGSPAASPPAYQAPQGGVIPPFTTAAIPAADARTAARAAAPVAAAPRPVPAARPAAKAAAAASASPKTYKGRYKLHIAATRARADAETIASKLATQHGGDLDNRTPSVDEAVIGSMGTFYRVRVGGYAKASQPKAICEKLRTSGFDCLVVTN